MDITNGANVLLGAVLAMDGAVFNRQVGFRDAPLAGTGTRVTIAE